MNTIAILLVICSAMMHALRNFLTKLAGRQAKLRVVV